MPLFWYCSLSQKCYSSICRCIVLLAWFERSSCSLGRASCSFGRASCSIGRAARLCFASTKNMCVWISFHQHVWFHNLKQTNDCDVKTFDCAVQFPWCSWYKQVIVLHLEANTLTSTWQMLTLIMCLCVRARWSSPFTTSISSWLTKFIFEQITNNACTNTLMLVVNNLGSAFNITEWLWYQILRLWCSTTSQRTNTFSRYIRIQWLWDQDLRFCR